MSMRIKDLPSSINTLIIDLGGVLLNIDYQASKHAFEALGVEDFDAHFSQMAQSHLFDRFETGKISNSDFLDELRREGEISASEVTAPTETEPAPVEVQPKKNKYLGRKAFRTGR